jgi:copper chaperone
METTTLTAGGIVCGGCAAAVKAAVGRVAGVTAVEVDVPEKRVVVTHDDRATRDAIAAALRGAGFDPV